MTWLLCPLLRVESWMCADDGEPSLIFSSRVGWRREDGGGMKGVSGVKTALLGGFVALPVGEMLQKGFY